MDFCSFHSIFSSTGPSLPTLDASILKQSNSIWPWVITFYFLYDNCLGAQQQPTTTEQPTINELSLACVRRSFFSSIKIIWCWNEDFFPLLWYLCSFLRSSLTSQSRLRITDINNIYNNITSLVSICPLLFHKRNACRHVNFIILLHFMEWNGKAQASRNTSCAFKVLFYDE